MTPDSDTITRRIMWCVAIAALIAAAFSPYIAKAF
jgi:hypothetical protein